MEFNPKNVRHNVGDKVVALDTQTLNDQCQKRVSGEVYTVKAVMFCVQCGIQAINIGQLSGQEFVQCECGESQGTQGKYWTDSYRFAPLQEIDHLMASAIETENYELAEVLKKAQPLAHPDEQEK